jgi:hypothetical protein
MNTITFFKTKKDAMKISHSLSITSKMPCNSYSLPSYACKVGAKMAKIKDSICSKCYASKGSYIWSTTINAMEKRLNSINDPLWVDAMIKLIGNDSYFRWHDSGDIQSIEHFDKICKIAKALPKTLFWIPTREYSIIKDYAKDHVIPKNLIIRLSAMFIDQRVTMPKSLINIPNITISNVHSKDSLGFECKAYKQNNECKECRACWNSDIKEVSYKVH